MTLIKGMKGHCTVFKENQTLFSKYRYKKRRNDKMDNFIVTYIPEQINKTPNNDNFDNFDITGSQSDRHVQECSRVIFTMIDCLVYNIFIYITFICISSN